MVSAVCVLSVRDTLDVAPFFPVLTLPHGPLATAAFLTRNRGMGHDALPALLLAAAKPPKNPLRRLQLVVWPCPS